MSTEKFLKPNLAKKMSFSKDVSDYWKTTSFTLPAVTVGSIIEFSYEINSPFPSIGDIDVQYDVPINHQDILVEMLEYFMYNVFMNPEAMYQVAFDKEKINGNVTVANARQDIGDPNYVPGSNSRSQKLATTDEVIGIQTKGVPALVDEPMIDDIDRYRAKLIFELAGTRFPKETLKYFSNTWESVANDINKNKNFGDQLIRTNFYRSDLEKVMVDVNSEKQKLIDILTFLRSKVKWNGYYGKLTQDGVKTAYNDGSGNVAEINLLLVSMLRSAGFNADPVLVSSKNNGIPLFPTQDGFNYVIAQVELTGKNYLLDATEPFTFLNVLPKRAAHWQGRVIKKNGVSHWVSLSASNDSQDITVINAIIEGGWINKVDVKQRLTQQEAFQARNNYANATKENTISQLQDDYTGLKINTAEIQNIYKLDQPVNIEFEGMYSKGTDVVGDKVYITPLLYKSISENPFKLESRLYPLDLDHPIVNKTIVNMSLPEGYEVESIPESVMYSFNDGMGTYSFIVKQINNVISTIATFKLTSNFILPKDYPSYRSYYMSIVEKNGEKIVLKKIDQ